MELGVVVFISRHTLNQLHLDNILTHYLIQTQETT